MIAPPKWAKNAIPSVKGWHDPRTNELLISRKHSHREVNEWNNRMQPKPKILRESPVTESDFLDENYTDNLNSLTKKQLENLGREYGIELDRRHKKSDLIQILMETIKS